MKWVITIKKVFSTRKFLFPFFCNIGQNRTEKSYINLEWLYLFTNLALRVELVIESCLRHRGKPTSGGWTKFWSKSVSLVLPYGGTIFLLLSNFMIFPIFYFFCFLSQFTISLSWLMGELQLDRIWLWAFIKVRQVRKSVNKNQGIS